MPLVGCGEGRDSLYRIGTNRQLLGTSVAAVSAAKEATLVDIPAIALSQCLMGNPNPRWQTAAHFAPGLITQLCKAGSTCKLTCAGGNCNMTCEEGATCEGDPERAMRFVDE